MPPIILPRGVDWGTRGRIWKEEDLEEGHVYTYIHAFEAEMQPILNQDLSKSLNFFIRNGRRVVLFLLLNFAHFVSYIVLVLNRAAGKNNNLKA